MFILISSKFVIAKRTSKTRKNFIRKYRLQQSLIVLVTNQTGDRIAAILSSFYEFVYVCQFSLSSRDGEGIIARS